MATMTRAWPGPPAPAAGRHSSRPSAGDASVRTGAARVANNLLRREPKPVRCTCSHCAPRGGALRGGTHVTKERSSAKETKKKPLKTMMEKRAAKKSKADGKPFLTGEHHGSKGATPSAGKR